VDYNQYNQLQKYEERIVEEGVTSLRRWSNGSMMEMAG